MRFWCLKLRGEIKIYFVKTKHYQRFGLHMQHLHCYSPVKIPFHYHAKYQSVQTTEGLVLTQILDLTRIIHFHFHKRWMIVNSFDQRYFGCVNQIWHTEGEKCDNFSMLFRPDRDWKSFLIKLKRRVLVSSSYVYF